MCMYDPDGGWWKVAHNARPRARKQHRCDECRRTIAVGEVYERFSGINSDSDEWETYLTCAHCDAATVWLIAACEGYMFGMVLADLREHWDEHESYRTPMLRALIDGMAARWYDGADPIPDVAAVRASVPVPAAS